MAKRISSFSKEWVDKDGNSPANKDIIKFLENRGIEGKTASSNITDEEAASIAGKYREVTEGSIYHRGGTHNGERKVVGGVGVTAGPTGGSRDGEVGEVGGGGIDDGADAVDGCLSAGGDGAEVEAIVGERQHGVRRDEAHSHILGIDVAGVLENEGQHDGGASDELTYIYDKKPAQTLSRPFVFRELNSPHMQPVEQCLNI